MSSRLICAAQNAAAEQDATKKDCRFCGKQGLLILPLLCGVLPSGAKPPSLPKNVCTHAKKIKIKQSAYSLRVARLGYLYALIKRLDPKTNRSELSWHCYSTNGDGYWAQFAPNAAPLDPPEFTCAPNTCGQNASMIAIPSAEDVPIAYFLFTPSPLSTNTLGELKGEAKAEELCAKGQMTKVHPSAWIGGSHEQENCLKPEQLADSVTEFSLAKNDYPSRSPLCSAALNATFPLMGAEVSSNDSASTRSMAMLHLARLPSLINFMAQHKAVGLALYDPIGIAQSLNDHRNDAYHKVEDFLGEVDGDNVTNRWKFDSMQAVQELKAGFENGLVADAANSVMYERMSLHARYEPHFPDDSARMTKLKYKWHAYTDPERATWPKRNPERYGELQKELAKLKKREPELLARVKAEAEKKWNDNYECQLDRNAIEDFERKFDAVGQAALHEAELRVDDHLAWVLSDQLIDAFDVYDKRDEVSGFHFEAQSALCSAGMSGIPKSAAQIDAWLGGTIGDRRNIYLRGLLLNQKAIEDEAAIALKAAEQAAANGVLTSSVVGQNIYKAIKGLIDLYRKADSTWDEYVREHKKVGNARSAKLRESWEGDKLFKMSELNRRVFRGGITNFEKKLVGYFGGLALARMGELAHKLRFDQLMYGVDPENPHIDPGSKKAYPRDYDHKSKPVPTADPDVANKAGQAAAKEAEDLRRKMMNASQYRHLERVQQGVVYTIDEYMQRPRTSNYHQVRIGGLLAVMETFALGNKLHAIYKSGGANSLAYWEAGASLLSVMSITCDLGYGLNKSLRETAAKTSNAVRAAADIARGGFKLWAGGFAATAGAITVLLDWSRFKSETEGANRTGEKIVLVARMIVGVWNTGCGATAAFSYSGPVFRRLAVDLSTKALKRRALASALATGAEWLAARVMLLRFLTWGSVAGLVVLGGEVLYYIYLYIQPNALQVWVGRSVFRNRSEGSNPYLSADQELEELAKARQEVGV